MFKRTQVHRVLRDIVAGNKLSKQSSYAAGFIQKCSEAGVDPEGLANLFK